MKKLLKKKGLQRIVFAVLAIVLVWGTIAASTVQAAGYTASYIKELGGKLMNNFESFLDSSVMFRLPVPHPLSQRLRDLQARHSGIQRVRARPLCRLPPAGAGVIRHGQK